MATKNWKELSRPVSAWESEAIEYLRLGLPDHEPYQAWSNCEFIADDGTINEIDVLVLTPLGLFLIEIKSRPGTLRGDSHTWTWITNERRYTDDNPLLLANRKARKLASLLRRQKAAEKRGIPYIEALVFCSSTDINIQLSESGRTNVFIRDTNGKGGILDALINRSGVAKEFSGNRLDKPTARTVFQALEQAGIRPSQRSRRVGDFTLETLGTESPIGVYQDWVANHVSLANTRRIVRLYPFARHLPASETKLIQRTAEKEFTALQDLVHPGIVLAESFSQTELGPAVVFRIPPTAQRLDHYMAERAGALNVTVRLDFVRQIAEALQYAHQKKTVHRALCPQSILVTNPSDPVPRLQILNWQLARRASSTDTSGKTRITGTLHAEQLVEDASAIYLSPEAQRDANNDDSSQDIFALGATAYFIFTGQPPAATPLDMTQRVDTEGGLDIGTNMDAAGDALRDLIRSSTHPEVMGRLEDAREFLHQLHAVEEELTTPENECRQNPLEAKAGDQLPGGLVVKERLGHGSTAIAFLVQRGEQELVLKLASKPDNNDRIKAEFATLNRLNHHGIIKADQLVTLHELSGILMERAGKETLARRLHSEGRLHLDFLERFGTDLIETVIELEKTGVSHRDIKPENIGIRERGKQSEQHLVLFDFSLSTVPAENIRCGTSAYLDPFLRQRKPMRWDLQAERFSAAVTLYEMATGHLPTWGDGKSDPSVMDCEVNLAPERFPAELRDRLSDFFSQALRRDYTKRFDHAQQMLESWSKCFDAVDQTTSKEPVDRKAQDELIAKALLSTQLVELGLSKRAANATDKINAITVRDLLKVSLWRLNRIAGVGKTTVREITELYGRLRTRFPDIEPNRDSVEANESTDGVSTPETASIDWLANHLLSSAERAGASERIILQVILGLEFPPRPGVPSWPSQSDVAKHTEVSRQRVSQVIAAARERWSRAPSITGLREVISHILTASGGAMTHKELSDAILAAKGSTETEPRRSQIAMAVLRAACETESGTKSARWVESRSDDRILITLNHQIGDYAFALAKEADELAQLDPLAPPSRVIETLRRVRQPEGFAALSDERLVRLAVSTSKKAGLSSRLEVYPKGLPPQRSIQLAAGALVGTRDLSVDEIRQRVLNRYPEAAPLPSRPELDSLLEQADARLKWDSTADDGRGAYRVARKERITIGGSSISAKSTTTNNQPAGPSTEQLTASQFTDRLQFSIRGADYLILVCTTPDYLSAEARLKSQYPIAVCDVEALLIEHMKAEASQRRVRWDNVLAADHTKADQKTQRLLRQLVESFALPKLKAHIASENRPILLTNIGLLAHFDQINFLEDLRTQICLSSETPRSLWVLVPSNDQQHLPTLHGRPVPVASRGQWERIPEAWLTQNLPITVHDVSP